MLWVGYIPLFAKGRGTDFDNNLAGSLRRTAQEMAGRLQSWNPDDLLNTPVDDVIETLVDKGSVRCPTLLRDDICALDPTEISIQFMDFGRQATRRVTRLVIVVPFEGEEEVFLRRPDTSTNVPPQVLRLGGQELHVALDDPPADPAVARAAFEEEIDRIEQYLGWSREQIEAHNRQIRKDVPGMVARRRDELLAARNLQADIGFPVRRRPDADTYAVPVRRSTVRSDRPRSHGARAPFKPEPVMEDRDYQAALRVLVNQRNALERTPSVFSKLKEEEIRDILLVGLNAQFEGDAGGELFNGEGKTDILIRVGDRNIFIGECKVWAGPKTVDDALSQLFGYLVWRDTKAAILLFVRNKDVSAVVRKAIDQIREHPNHKRSNVYEDTSAEEYAFTMHAEGDVEREVHLTLIPFALRPNPTEVLSGG
jgi:hypothetical protein